LQGGFMRSRIGDNIKFFRGQKGMTQEQLAELLGISHQSVSKWESGITIPDVMLLPELAKIFHVSIDDIFGYIDSDEVHNVQSLMRRIDDATQHSDLKEAEKICRKGLELYPNSPELMLKMAILLKTKYLIAGQKDIILLDEAISMCNIVIRITNDAKLVHTAYKTKAISQAYKGDKTAAVQTAENVINDYDYIMVYLTDGDEKIRMCKLDIEAHLKVIRNMLRLIGKVYHKQGKVDKYKKFKDATVSLSIEL